ncbi:MAG: hypothetical protein GY804_02560 [Alphaproteobacteria bacterium]|nr:hypothetical protein [Alphaproteobacteria bacterium]
MNILTAYSKAFDKLWDWIASKLKNIVKSSAKASDEAEEIQKKFDHGCPWWLKVDGVRAEEAQERYESMFRDIERDR